MRLRPHLAHFTLPPCPGTHAAMDLPRPPFTFGAEPPPSSTSSSSRTLSMFSERSSAVFFRRWGIPFSVQEPFPAPFSAPFSELFPASFRAPFPAPSSSKGTTN